MNKKTRLGLKSVSVQSVLMGLFLLLPLSGVSFGANSNGDGNASSSMPADGYSNPSSSPNCATTSSGSTDCTSTSTTESGGFTTTTTSTTTTGATTTNPGQGYVDASAQAHLVANCNSDVQGKDCSSTQTNSSTSGGSAPVYGGPPSAGLNPTTMGNGRQTRNFIK